MTHEAFNDYQAKLLAEVVGMKDTKGREYSNSESRFANFDRGAKKNGVSRLVVANIYMTKHLDSLDHFIKTNGKEEPMSEPIRGRIVDAITYLTLIGGMIEEEDVEGVNSSQFWMHPPPAPTQQITEALRNARRKMK